MDRLLSVRRELEDTTSTIAQLESAFASNPAVESLLLSIQSLANRRDALEAEFMQVAASRGHEVCSYRLFASDETQSASAVGEALVRFQHFFSTVYEVLTHGRKDKARLSQETIRDTEFGFGYSFPGSVGVVLTLPNAPTAETPTNLDRSVDLAFQIATTTDPDAVAAVVHNFGMAPIRAAHKWVRVHTEHTSGASINWHGSRERELSLTLDVPQLARLQQAIEASADETHEELTLTGFLTAADVPRHSFKLLVDGQEIKGRFKDAISEDQSVRLPSRYKARLRKTIRVHLGMDKIDESYFLLELEQAE